MSMSADTLRKHLIERALVYWQMPLMAHPDGHPISLEEGYIPLLVNFTEEDKAAKGLRKLQDRTEPEPPVYFSALEMARDHSALLLVGETGSGKTTFARHLCGTLARQVDHHRSVVRNDSGVYRDEIWDAAPAIPLYLEACRGQSFEALVDAAVPELASILTSEAWASSFWTLHIVLDGLEAAGDDAAKLLLEAARFQSEHPRVRLLALGEREATKGLVPPQPFARFSLLPLLEALRVDAARKIADLDIRQSGVGLGPAAGNPAQFAMALRAASNGHSPEEIVDAWLSRVAGDPQTSRFLAGLAYDCMRGMVVDADVLPVRRVRQLLAACHLVELPSASAAGSFHSDPPLWAPVIRSLAARQKGAFETGGLVESLMTGDGEASLRGALLASEFAVGPAMARLLAERLFHIVEYGALTPAEREQAGRWLAAWGDPRDLWALATVPGGTFTMGSTTHPNSAPPHSVTVEPFRIGIYPVTNGLYAEFVKATNRVWVSPDGLVPERRSAPATDVTWHDANAYCVWLTERWRRDGRLADTEIVRLPTEPEWERAARGDQADAGPAIVYPWGTFWQDDASNSEEIGFNNTCTVGLFPKGCSPYGCYDMTGQVWEWCTTLWGQDMATPSFHYPYRTDGREAENAGREVRRVLRGGCFSSGQQKACCTYRGSLEPEGFWRGNGFRIVVSNAKV